MLSDLWGGGRYVDGGGGVTRSCLPYSPASALAPMKYRNRGGGGGVGGCMRMGMPHGAVAAWGHASLGRSSRLRKDHHITGFCYSSPCLNGSFKQFAMSSPSSPISLRRKAKA